MGRLRSISLLTVLNGAGAALAVVTSAVVAHLFGTARVLEVFFAASSLLTLMVSLTQTGQLAEIVIPLYHAVKQREGSESAHRAYSMLTNWILIWVSLLTSGLWIAAPWLVPLLVPGFSGADHGDATRVFRWLAPLIPIQVAAAMQLGWANAERQFGKAEVWSVVAHAASLAATASLAPRLGTWALVVSLWVSSVVVLAGYSVVLRGLSLKHWWVLRHQSCRVQPVFAKLASTLTYVGGTQVYGFALNASLSLLPQGVYATFNYVWQLYAKTSSLLLRPVSTVFFTHFAENAARVGSRLSDTVEEALSRMLAVGSVAAILGICAGGSALGGLWGSSRFGAENLQFASRLLGLLLCLLVVTGQGLIWRKYAASLGLIRQAYVSSAIAQLASAGVLLVLVHYLGLVGLVAAIMCGAGILSLSTAVPLWLRLRSSLPRYRMPSVLKWAGTAVFAVLVVVGSTDLLGMRAQGRLANLGVAAGQVVAASVCMATAAVMFHVPEADMLVAAMRRWKARRTERQVSCM